MSTVPPRTEARAPRIGAAGIGLMSVGAVLLLVSFTAVNWYPGSTGADAQADITFSKLRALSGGAGVPAITHAYFAWLAWVLLILVIVVAFAANLPTQAANPLRVAGLFAGLVGAAVTYLALEQPHQGTSGGAFDHAQVGIWLALGGYLLAGLGASLGPVRQRP
ncbi:MAG: hypothetical protein ACR2LF_02590 [Jatrophihabitantaceae bacterium]